MSDLEKMFPDHAASLHLTHNEHKGYYQSVADWIDENDSRDFYEWISPEQRALALKTDNVWTLQWYPFTPVGFVSFAAAELEPLLAFAREHKP